MPEEHDQRRPREALRNLKLMCDRNTELESRIDAAVKILAPYGQHSADGWWYLSVDRAREMLALLTGERKEDENG